MNKTAADVEREVEASRSDLDRNVEALKGKMTPGQIFDEASRAMGGAGQQVLSKLVDQIKENPMPLAVMGLGLAWLMSGSSRKSDDGGYERYRGYSEPRSFGSQSERGGGMRERMHGLGDKATDALSEAKDRLSDMGASAGDRGRQAFQTLGSAASSAADRAAQYGDQAKQAFGNVLEREPLIIGALGLVVGAAIGASLPNTAVEDRAVGPLRDKVLDKGKDLAQDGLQQASDVAQAVYASAKDEIQKPQHGEQVDPVERAGDIARTAVKAGKDQLNGPGGQAQSGGPA
jgi:hypothetical protein